MKVIKKWTYVLLMLVIIGSTLLPVSANNEEEYVVFNFDPASAVVGEEYIVYQDNNETISVKILKYTPAEDLGEQNQGGVIGISPYYAYDKGTSMWSGNYPDGTYDLQFSRTPGAGFYTAKFRMNFTISNGGGHCYINYIYGQGITGPLFNIQQTDFRILKQSSQGGYAAAVYSWDADLNIGGVNIIHLNGFLKVESNGGQTRIIWQL